MKKQLAFAGVVVAGLVVTMAAVNAQRPGGLGPRGGGQGLGPGQGQGFGQGQGLGRMGRGPGGPGGPGMGRGGRGGPGMMLAGLDLTDDQKAQVKQVFESERDANQAARQAQHEARQALQAAIFGANGAGANVAALQAKVMAGEQALLAQHVATQKALSGILTVEQKVKLLERGGRRGGGGGGGERGPGFGRGRGREIK